MKKTHTGINGISARTTYRFGQQLERKAARVALGLPCDKLGTLKVVRLPLLKLAASIHAEIAPAIATMRETEDFINSGKSLLGYLADKARDNKTVASKLVAPPLPIGLPMPANVCLNPAFTV